MDRYHFHYLNRDVQQEKVLIPHADWLKVKAMPMENKADWEAQEKAYKALGNGEEWFTDQSPLFFAIETGILDCNGKYPVKITKL